MQASTMAMLPAAHRQTLEELLTQRTGFKKMVGTASYLCAVPHPYFSWFHNEFGASEKGDGLN